MSVRVSRRRLHWLSALPTVRVSYFPEVYEKRILTYTDANLFKESFEKAQQENEKVGE